MTRPTFASFKEKALTDPEVKTEYDQLAPASRPNARRTSRNTSHEKEQYIKVRKCE